MKNKTIEEKVAEKQKSLADIQSTYKMTLELYEIATKKFSEDYDTNRSKTDAKHLMGLASLLDKLNNLVKTRNEIENEVSALLELENQGSDQQKDDRIQGSKESILKIVEGGKK